MNSNRKILTEVKLWWEKQTLILLIPPIINMNFNKCIERKWRIVRDHTVRMRAREQKRKTEKEREREIWG